MFKKLYDWLFGRKNEPTFHEYCENRRLKQREEYQAKFDADKPAWEAKNELARKIDACNLGFTKTAFNGTYEQYLQYEQSKMYGLQQVSATNAQAAANIAQMQALNNMGPYGMALHGNPLGGIFR